MGASLQSVSRSSNGVSQRWPVVSLELVAYKSDRKTSFDCMRQTKARLRDSSQTIPKLQKASKTMIFNNTPHPHL